MGFFNTSSGLTVETLRAGLNYSTTAVDTGSRINSQNAIFATGNCYFTFFTPLTNMTVSQVMTASAGTAATSVTYAAMGLYTFDGTTATLVARTASDTTMFTSTFTNYTRNFSTVGGFPADYVLTAGQRYALAVLVTTTGTDPAVYINNGFIPNNLSVLDPRVTGVVLGQTSLPLTADSFTASSAAPWGRFS